MYEEKHGLEENKSKTKRLPDLIVDGANVELWFSVELNSKVILKEKNEIIVIPPLSPGQNPQYAKTPSRSEFMSKLNGTVLIQGLFFAHNEEPEPTFFSGSRTPEYFPDKKETTILSHKFERQIKW